jgi:hypothetical protein
MLSRTLDKTFALSARPFPKKLLTTSILAFLPVLKLLPLSSIPFFALVIAGGTEFLTGLFNVIPLLIFLPFIYYYNL